MTSMIDSLDFGHNDAKRDHNLPQYFLDRGGNRGHGNRGQTTFVQRKEADLDSFRQPEKSMQPTPLARR